MMQQFKDKDWLRVIAGHERPINSVFQIKSCLTRYKLSNVELWRPKEGEYIMNHRYGLCRVERYKEDSISEILVYPIALAIGSFQYIEASFCEPFIGELPSFLKEQK